MGSLTFSITTKVKVTDRGSAARTQEHEGPQIKLLRDAPWIYTGLTFSRRRKTTLGWKDDKKIRLRVWLKYERRKQQHRRLGVFTPEVRTNLLRTTYRARRKDFKRERRPAKPPPGPEVCLLPSYLYIYGNATLAPGKRETTQNSSGFPVFLVKLHSAKFYNRTQAQKLSFPFSISIILLIYVKF